LKSLVTSKNSLMHYEKSERTLFIYSAMVLRGWSHLFACRLDDSLQIGSDAALYATISLGIPLSLHKWAVELLIVTKILRGNYHAAQVDWEKLQPISHRDLSSPTSCALLSILNIYKGSFLYSETVPYCRYACLKLAEKQFTSPVAPLFLFYAAYAALRIIEFCKMEVDSEFRQRTERAYERFEIPSPHHPHVLVPAAADSCPSAPPSSPVASPTTRPSVATTAPPSSGPPTPRSTKKFRDRDYRAMMDLLIPCVNLVIRKFESSQRSLPISQVFGGTLIFMKQRILTPATNLTASHATLLRHFTSHFEYFSLGLYHFHYEAAIYLASRDGKQAQMEADQSYEMARKLMIAGGGTATSSNGSTNSPHHSNEFSPPVGGGAGVGYNNAQVLSFLQTEEDHASSSAGASASAGGQQPIMEAWSPSRRKKNETKTLAQIAESESMHESKEERIPAESEAERDDQGGGFEDEVRPFIAFPSGRARKDRRDEYLEEKKGGEEGEGDGLIFSQFDERDDPFLPTTGLTMTMEKS
jgi:hypothetical protein